MKTERACFATLRIIYFDGRVMLYCDILILPQVRCYFFYFISGYVLRQARPSSGARSSSHAPFFHQAICWSLGSLHALFFGHTAIKEVPRDSRTPSMRLRSAGELFATIKLISPHSTTPRHSRAIILPSRIGAA